MANYISREEAYQRWGEPRIRDYATHSSQRKSRQRPAPTATTEQIDASLDNAIARTTDVINSYIGGIVKLPLASTNTPPILKTIALYLVLSEVRVGVDEDENSEPLRWRREGIRLLEKINKGEIKIGVLPDGTELAEDGPCIGVAGAAANQLTSPHSEFGEAYQSSFDGREPVQDGFISEGTTTFINQGGNANIEDLSITTAKLGNGSVTRPKLNTPTPGTNGNILAIVNDGLAWVTPVSAQIGPGSVDTINLADMSVTTAKIADGNVTADKIVDLNASKITSGVFNDGRIPDLDASKITTGVFDVGRIAQGGTTGQVLERTATGARWVTRTQGGADIDPGDIGTAELADGSVTTPKIHDGAVISTKIPNGAIATNHLAHDSVTNDQIANRAIDNSDMLASSVIQANHLAGGIVDITKLNDTNTPTLGMYLTAGNNNQLTWRNLPVLSAIDTFVQGTTYNDNTIVLYSGDYWICQRDGTTTTPTEGTAWTKIITGTLNFISSVNVANTFTGDGTTGSPLDLANGVVTSSKLANSSVTTDKINNGSITPNKIKTAASPNNNDVLTYVGGDFVWGAPSSGGGLSTVTTSAPVSGNGSTASPVTINNSAITATYLADNAVTGSKILNGAVGADKIANNAVTTAKITDGNVTRTKIASGAVGPTQLSSSAVETDKIDRQAVTALKIADNAVETNHIKNDAVTTAKIDDNAVTGAQIADNAITKAKMTDNSVGSDELEDNSVGADQIADRAVSSGNLDIALSNRITANDAKVSYPSADQTKLAAIENNATADQTGAEIVTRLTALTGGARLPASAVRDLPSGGGGGSDWRGVYSDGTSYAVGDRVIYNGEIYVCVVVVPNTNSTPPSATNSSWIHLSNESGYQTAAELVTALQGLTGSARLDYSAIEGTPTALPPTDNSVTEIKIASNAVTQAKMADNSVGTSELLDNAVTDDKILSVSASKISGTIESDQIGNNQVTASKIPDASITGTKIAGSTITSANLANNSVTAAQIAAGAVDSSELADEAVTTGKLGTGAVTNAKIANGTISGLKILGETITAGHLDTATTGTQGQIIARDTGASGGIAWIDAPSGGGSEPADGSITSAKLAANAVTKAKVADDAIGTDELDTATAGTDGQYLTKSGSQFAYVDAPSGGGGGSVVLSDWAAGTSYAQNEAVIHNGEVFVAKSAITPTLANTTPDMDSEHWEVVNEWNSIDTYTTGQAVLRNGTVYRALNDISATQTDSEFGSIGPTGGSQYASNANYRGDGSVVFGHSGGTQSFPPRSDDNTNVYTIQISGNSTESRNGIVQGSYDYITDNSTTVRCRVGSASQMQAQFGTEDFSTGGGSIVLREYTPNTAPESDSTNWQSITSSAWSGSATYAENDVVTNGTPAVYYRSKFAIASPANTSPNMSNAFWDLVGGNVSVPAWVSGTIYTVGTRVTDDGATWECLSAVRSTQKPIRERSVWRKVSTEIIRQLLVQSVNRFDNIFPYSYSGNGRIVEDYDWIEFRVLYSTNQGTFIDHPVVVPAASWAGNTSFSFSGGQLISSGASSLRRGSIYRLNSQNTSSLRRTGFQLSGDVGFSAVYGIR